MKQLTQKLKDGWMGIVDVPAPVVSRGLVLVRNAYSVISAGTEGSTVRAARKNLLGKARERPQQARQMLDLLAQAGPVQAYRTLQKKLDSYSPLGYSTAGFVLAVGEGVTGFAVGDKVACAGATASHAELVAVPENLCVRLDPEADLSMAAYNTLGAIAMQGVRQADLRLGESCAVIGLGLLGQLVALLLRAGGVRTFGIDVNPAMVKLAAQHSADDAGLRSELGLAERIHEFSSGLGVDAVIITAAAHDTDPVNFAGRIVRQKGRVVVVGNVPTGFDREPYYYRKELDLRMSCSYGPGRYDPSYEEKGIDYPAAYVRWTEKRNMEAFQHLLHAGRLNLAYLTTHRFPLDSAAQAYELITTRSEPHVGILLEYSPPELATTVPAREASPVPGTRMDGVGVAFVGAGSYAMSHLLPNLPKESWLRRSTVLTASGLSARTVADRFSFKSCAASEKDVFENESVNVVFVATRHDTHSEYVQKAIRHGKTVFVEKPLCITEQQLDEITGLMRERPSARLMVGFNRRFSPLISFVRERIGMGRMSMMYRINSGAIPVDSWIQDRERGGGRIIGEVCHFIDLLTFLNGSLPGKVQAFALPDAAGVRDTVSINVSFENGSVGSICYFSNGSKGVAKEYIEIYRDGATAIVRDFKEAEVLGGSGAKARKKLLFQDKGQSRMIQDFLTATRNGAAMPISFAEISAVTRATLRTVEATGSGSALSI